jgi:hypothetical protein
MGSVLADDPDAPKSICIRSTGFWYFGGDPQTPWAQDLINTIPPFDLIMPSAQGKMYGERLMPFTRYSFSAANLKEKTIQEILQNSPYKEKIVPIDLSIVDILQLHSETGFEIVN